MAYAAPADLLVGHDSRDVGALVNDDGTVSTPTQLNSNANLLALFDRASGIVEAYLLTGGRYSVDDLAGLPTNANAYLVQITCDIVWGLLYERRSWDESDQKTAALDRANSALKILKSGDAIFGLPADIEAGTGLVTGPSYIAYQNLNTIAGRCRGPFYPPLRLPWAASN